MDINKETLQRLIEISIGTGNIIMPFYDGSKDIGLQTKDDSSPVTLADQHAEIFILEQLEKYFPDISIIAEEKAASGDIPDLDNGNGTYFFLVDPLDGTKEFINKRKEFTVNIAIIKGNEPVMGVIYAPALGDIYAGIKGENAFHLSEASSDLRDAKTMKMPRSNSPMIAVASRSYMNDDTKEFIDNNDIKETVSAGSSLKFCMLAAGKADIYPRFGRTMEWDIAAGDAILRAAGGVIVTIDGAPMTYGKRNQANDTDFANPYFIAKKA